MELPQLPAKGMREFISLLSDNPKTPVWELLKPYKAFEGELRKIYAQQPSHEALKDGSINLVPVFEGIQGVS